MFFYFLFPDLIAENWYPQTYIITDGDTLKRNGVRYRLEGLDAPEINQICPLIIRLGMWISSSLYLEQLHGKEGLSVRILGKIAKRTLIRCYIFKDDNRMDIEILWLKRDML